MTVREKQNKLYAFCITQKECKSCQLGYHCTHDWFGPLRDCIKNINNLYDIFLKFQQNETKVNIMCRGEIIGSI